MKRSANTDAAVGRQRDVGSAPTVDVEAVEGPEAQLAKRCDIMSDEELEIEVQRIRMENENAHSAFEKEARAHATPHDDEEAMPTPTPEAQPAAKAAAVTLSLMPTSARSLDVKISFRSDDEGEEEALCARGHDFFGHDLPRAHSREPPPPLPGGFKLGEMLYYIDYSHTIDCGDSVVHGQQGEVMGPVLEDPVRIAMMFPGNKGNIGCRLEELSREPPPPLPGGFKLGEMLYYIGNSETFYSGDSVVHGQQGEVMGPALEDPVRIAMMVPGNKWYIACRLEELSREPPPPLPGGFKLGEMLYYIGNSETFYSGDSVVHGQQGEVIGPALEDPVRIAIMVPGNKGNIRCRLEELSREPPPSPPSPPPSPSLRLSNVSTRERLQARVAARSGKAALSSAQPPSKDNAAQAARAVAEAAAERAAEALLQEELREKENASRAASKSKKQKAKAAGASSSSAARPAEAEAIEVQPAKEEVEEAPLLEGARVQVGEVLYYIEASDTWEDGDRWVHGQQGEVVTVSLSNVTMMFPGNKEASTMEVGWVSRLPPPPLPGGYQLGEMLYFLGTSQTFDSGDLVVHGQQGKVKGPYLQSPGRIKMLFPGNKGYTRCRLQQLSRDPPPPLPGGFKLGEMLYFIGTSHTFDNGDRVVHGQQGEVMGPDLEDPDSMSLRFPGNTRRTGCFFKELSRTRPAASSARERLQARVASRMVVEMVEATVEAMAAQAARAAAEAEAERAAEALLQEELREKENASRAASKSKKQKAKAAGASSSSAARSSKAEAEAPAEAPPALTSESPSADAPSALDLDELLSAESINVALAPAAAKDEEKCVVCFEGALTHLFAPCCHQCVCATCAAAVMERCGKCPICCTPAATVVDMTKIWKHGVK